jgi:arylsulfatase A-like enzyme
MRAIILVLNRARLDAIGAYGAEDVATPHLDRLALEGIVFDQHFAERPTERGARHAWELGCACSASGLRSPQSLAEKFWRSHIRCALIGSEDGISRRTGFAHGWERVVWVRRAALTEMNQPTLVDGVLQTAVDWLESYGQSRDSWCLWVEVDALRPPWDEAEYADLESVAASAAAEQEAGETDQGRVISSSDPAGAGSETSVVTPPAEPTVSRFPPSVETQADDPHPKETEQTEEADLAEEDAAAEAEEADGFEEPAFDCRSTLIDPDNPDDEVRLRRWRRAYAGIMTYIDDLIGQFVALLKELQLYEDVLLLVTSDVGWPLGEHGGVGDALIGLHEELIHLPLIIRLPGGAQAGRRVQQLTQPVDLYATLSEFFNLIWSPAMGQGQSLLPLARGATQRMREYICSRLRRQGIEEWSIRTHTWHLIVPVSALEEDDPPRERRLYLKPDDRWEVQNLADQYPDVAEHLELTLRRYMASTWLDPLLPAPPLRDSVLRISN